MKCFIKASLLLVIPLFLASCSESADRKEVSDNADAMADSVASGMKANKDEEFVEDLLEENAQAVAWSNAGFTKGMDAELKKEASAMMTYHEVLANRLRGIASTKAYEMDDLPDEDSTDAAQNAAEDKPGAGWDDDWADKMVRLHKKMMNRLDDYADDTKDTEILSFINDTRPKLADHLRMSEALAERLKD